MRALYLRNGYKGVILTSIKELIKEYQRIATTAVEFYTVHFNLLFNLHTSLDIVISTLYVYQQTYYRFDIWQDLRFKLNHFICPYISMS